MSTKTADTLIVLSDNISKYFKDKYDKDSVKICNAIDIKEFKPADLISKEFGLKANGYFLTVGRIVEEKGLHYLTFLCIIILVNKIILIIHMLMKVMNNYKVF